MAKNIFNIISNTLIGGTSGNDTIENYGDSVTISGGTGNDKLYRQQCNNFSWRR